MTAKRPHQAHINCCELSEGLTSKLARSMLGAKLSLEPGLYASVLIQVY